MQLDGRYRFDNFVVGPANQAAVDVARAIARSTAYESLMLITGAPGLGKSHLLSAIGYEASASTPAATVAALTADELARPAPARGRADSAQSADLVLVDDIQFLGGHTGAQAELLSAIAITRGRRVPVVLTCDRALSDLELTSDLANALAAARVVTLGEPDDAMRSAMLAMWARERGIGMNADAAQVLAREVVGSPRDLLRMLGRAVALTGSDKRRMVTLDDARSAISALAQTPATNGHRRGEYLDFLSDVAQVVAHQLERLPVAESSPRAAPRPLAAATPVTTKPRVAASQPSIDRERIVWEWPDPTGRLIEEWRS